MLAMMVTTVVLMVDMVIEVVPGITEETLTMIGCDLMAAIMPVGFMKVALGMVMKIAGCPCRAHVVMSAATTVYHDTAATMLRMTEAMVTTRMTTTTIEMVI